MSRSIFFSVILGLSIALFSLTPAACSDSAPGDEPGDAGGDDGMDGTDEEPPIGLREVVASTHFRTCTGCDGVSWCGLPPADDITVIEFVAAPNQTTGMFFAAERWSAAGRDLPIDTCVALTGDALAPVIEPIVGVEVLDAGTIGLDMGMPGWDAPIELEFEEITHNYPALAAVISGERQYLPGTALSLDAAGGADVGPFGCQSPAPQGLVVLTPHTDAQGQIDNIPTEGALEVTWSGGTDFDTLVLILDVYWCPWTVSTVILCRVTNDGAFTVPADKMAAIEWSNVAELSLHGSRKVAIDANGLDQDAAWTVRAWGGLPAYYDPDAVRPYPPLDCVSDGMAEGSAGDPCTTDAECGGGCCLTPVEEVYFMGGYCSRIDCASDNDCPSDSACVSNPHPQVPIQSFCGLRCAIHDDCRSPEYACLETDGADVCRPNFW